MNDPGCMRDAARRWVRRTPGRRASDRRPTIENLLCAAGVLVWAWCIYEVARLLIR